MGTTFRGINWLSIAAIAFGFLIFYTGGCECPAPCNPRVIAGCE